MHMVSIWMWCVWCSRSFSPAVFAHESKTNKDLPECTHTSMILAAVAAVASATAISSATSKCAPRVCRVHRKYVHIHTNRRERTSGKLRWLAWKCLDGSVGGDGGVNGDGGWLRCGKTCWHLKCDDCSKFPHSASWPRLRAFPWMSARVHSMLASGSCIYICVWMYLRTPSTDKYTHWRRTFANPLNKLKRWSVRSMGCVWRFLAESHVQRWADRSNMSKDDWRQRQRNGDDDDADDDAGTPAPRHDSCGCHRSWLRALGG